LKWVLVIFSCFLTSYAEVPFHISQSDKHLILRQKEATLGKLFVDFYEGHRKLSDYSFSKFLSKSENIELVLPRTINNRMKDLNAVITVLNVRYELEESKLMFGSGPGQFREGVSIRSDSFNQIYLVDTAQEAVLKFDEKLKFIGKFGSFNIDDSESFDNDFANIEEGQFDGINDLVAGPRLTTFISDSRNQRVVEVDSSGNFVREFSPRDGFDEPTKLQANQRNEILVLDSENERIVVFNNFGSQVFSIGGYGKGDHRFLKLIDFIVDLEDNLVCLDQIEKSTLLKKYSRNGRLLKKKKLKGQYLTIARDYWGHLLLIGDSELRILDSELRLLEQLFKEPKHILGAESITYMDNKKLYSLHNNPGMVRIFNPRLKLLQSKVQLLQNKHE
tara:strand:- start:3194 stop:4363 length:1170 start_codon:yes stop_codon:yes gene_type:complete